MAHAQPGEGLSTEQVKAIAREAYVFCFPLVMNYRMMYIQAIDSSSKSYSGGFGKWRNLGTASPQDTDVVTPNNDTPYSWAWVDLRTEPWVLTMPKIDPKRFYTSQWDDLWGFVLDNPGSVEDGNGGEKILLAAPGWKGDLPAGIERVIQGESEFLGTLTRTQMIDPSDLPNVEKIQGEYGLEPLSAFLATPAPEAAMPVSWMPWQDNAETTEDFWAYANFMLGFTTPNPIDKPTLDKIAQIGVGAGMTWNSASQNKDFRKGMQAGLNDARADLKKQSQADPDIGLFFRSRVDAKDDYNDRALGVYMGQWGNARAQSVYFSVPKDAEGDLLDGSKGSYAVTFTADQLPPVEYFWSWTMYRLPQRSLVENPINRYNLSSATPQLEKADDGSLTISFGTKSPGNEKEGNWLPAPAGPFWLVMRAYGPGKAILDKTWKMPPVTRTR